MRKPDPFLLKTHRHAETHSWGKEQARGWSVQGAQEHIQRLCRQCEWGGEWRWLPGPLHWAGWCSSWVVSSTSHVNKTKVKTDSMLISTLVKEGRRPGGEESTLCNSNWDLPLHREGRASLSWIIELGCFFTTWAVLGLLVSAVSETEVAECLELWHVLFNVWSSLGKPVLSKVWAVAQLVGHAFCRHSCILCTSHACVWAGGEEMRLHEETRKQNDMLEQIHDGLGTLMQGARVRDDCCSLESLILSVHEHACVWERGGGVCVIVRICVGIGWGVCMGTGEYYLCFVCS